MIQSLAYLGFTSPAADEWRTFGPDELGLQLAPDGPEGAVRLRLDERAYRLAVAPGERDDLDHVGWEVGDEAGLDAVVARLAAAGLSTERDDALAAERGVAALARFTDPFGFRHELTHGPTDGGPFVPGRPLTGRFVTGDQGLGHAVLLVPDLDAGLDFFVGVLGFRLSDHVEVGRLSLRFLHCNRRHHTVALAAVPGMAGLHHVMVELTSVDDVGRGLDLVTAAGRSLSMSLGRHPNDLVTSFYVRTPSGFDLEYGTGGRTIDDDATWTVETYDAISLWGHRPPEGGAPRPAIVRPVGARG